MVDDGFVVLADDIDTKFLGILWAQEWFGYRRKTYNNIIGLKLKGLGLNALWGESLTINKRPIRALDVLDVDLGDTMGPMPE